jgi:hypothetical protein
VTILLVIAGTLACAAIGRTGWLAITALLASGTLGLDGDQHRRRTYIRSSPTSTI